MYFHEGRQACFLGAGQGRRCGVVKTYPLVRMNHCVTRRAGFQPVNVPMGAAVSTLIRVSSPPSSA